MAANAISILIQAKDQGAASLFRKTGSAVDALTGNVRSNHESIEKANSSWLKTGAIVGAAAAVVSTVGNRAFAELNSLIGDAVSRVDTLNNFPRIMSNFGVSADDANKMIKELDLGVRGLPTSLNDIVQLAQGFVPLTKNTDEATKTALALNNAILAGGAPAQVRNAAYEQFRQALAKGKPELQDWKSLEAAMPAQLLQVIDKLNLGSGALSGYNKNAMGLYNAMQDGKLTINDFNQALRDLNEKGINGFPNLQQQAKNATQGIATGFENAKTAAVRGVGAIINAIGADNISNALSNFGKGVEWVLGKLAGFVDPTKKAIDFLRDLGVAVWQYLSPKLAALGDTIQTKLMPVLGNLWHGMIEPMLPVIGQALVWAIGAAVDITNGLVTAISWLITQFQQGNPWIITITGAFAGLAAALAIKSLIDGVRSAFDVFRLATIPAVIERVGALSTLVATPMVMPAIAVGAALAALALVYQKAQETMAVVNQTAAFQEQQHADSTKTSINMIKYLKQKHDAGQISDAEFRRQLAIFSNASGTPYSPGGLTLVGERGPELVQMPAGAKVTQAYRTRQELSQSAGVTINEHGTYIFNNQQEWDAQEARRDQTARLAMRGMA